MLCNSFLVATVLAPIPGNIPRSGVSESNQIYLKLDVKKPFIPFNLLSTYFLSVILSTFFDNSSR